jgi:hypothetical protein
MSFFSEVAFQKVAPGRVMQVNKTIRLSVGAELSRTPPIYRPSVDVPVSELFC